MKNGKFKLLWRPIILIVAIAALFSLTRVFNLMEGYEGLRVWIASLGAWGPLVYVALFSMGVVASFPTPVMKVGAVVLFGAWEGAIVIIAGISLGASLAFIISRYLARDSIAKWMSSNTKIHKLDNLTKKYGAGIVAIVRFVPIIPFSVQNYGFGLTKISFRTYVVLTFICMIPNTIFYAASTDVFLKGVERGEIAWIVAVTLAIAFVIFMLVARYVRQHLKDNASES